MRYKLLTESQLDPQQRNLAHETVAEVSRVLKIPMPAINFFRRVTEFESTFGTFETSDDYADGYTAGAEIFLCRNLPDKDLMLTAVHETRHVWQNKSATWRNRSVAQRERDARLFAAAWPRTENRAEILAFKKLLTAEAV